MLCAWLSDVEAVQDASFDTVYELRVPACSAVPTQFTSRARVFACLRRMIQRTPEFPSARRSHAMLAPRGCGHVLKAAAESVWHEQPYDSKQPYNSK